MKKNLSIFKIVVALALLISLMAPLSAAPDVVARIRLYEGSKMETDTPAKVVASVSLKPISQQGVVFEVDEAKEKESLKRVFNLKTISVLARAHMTLPPNTKDSPSEMVVLSGSELVLRLSTIDEKKNRFKVEVREGQKKQHSLLETQIVLPEKKTTVLGFEDSAGKMYFLSFHRAKNKAIDAKDIISLKAIHKPRLLKKTTPQYPQDALDAHISGNVIINATTDTQGRVVDTHVVSGPEPLRRVATDAIKQWVYEPYILDGVAKPVRFTVVIRFNLDKKKKTSLGGESDKGKNAPIPMVPAAQRPRLLKKVNPQYPAEALKAGITGTVVIEATTDTRGHVIDAKVIDGPDIFKKAALTALKQWVYEPYIINGEKKGVKFTVVIKFNLDKKK